MSRDHLRLVSGSSAPCAVTQLETLSVGLVGGELIILHNDKRITPIDAVGVLFKILRLLKPAMLRSGLVSPEAELKLRRLLPGDLGGAELADEDPLFPKDRHQVGYPVDGPKPVCAEIDGDGA